MSVVVCCSNGGDGDSCGGETRRLCYVLVVVVGLGERAKYVMYCYRGCVCGVLISTGCCVGLGLGVYWYRIYIYMTCLLKWWWL